MAPWLHDEDVWGLVRRVQHGELRVSGESQAFVLGLFAQGCLECLRPWRAGVRHVEDLQSPRCSVDRDDKQVLIEGKGPVLGGLRERSRRAKYRPPVGREVHICSADLQLPGLALSQEREQLPSSSPTHRYHGVRLVELRRVRPRLPPQLPTTKTRGLQHLCAAWRKLLWLLRRGRHQLPPLHEHRGLEGCGVDRWRHDRHRGQWASQGPRRQHRRSAFPHHRVQIARRRPHVLRAHRRISRRVHTPAAILAGLLHNLFVDAGELLPPDLNGTLDILDLARLVVHNHVQPGVLVDLAEGPHAPAGQLNLPQAGIILDLLHALAPGAQDQPDHVHAIDTSAAIDAALGLGEPRQQVAGLVCRVRQLAADGEGRGWAPVQLMLRQYCMVMAIEDNIRHALRHLLPSQKQDLLNIGGAEAVEVLPQVALRALPRQPSNEDFQVRRQTVFVLRHEVRAEGHVHLIDVDFLADQPVAAHG
mmetsp:Transcript_13560/g.39054  ORF Transcript_13560/g.39054 Transcript_13560/m.39054 type:complete len:475 (-) Transcript_13560:2135-3559(-)